MFTFIDNQTVESICHTCLLLYDICFVSDREAYQLYLCFNIIYNEKSTLSRDDRGEN